MISRPRFNSKSGQIRIFAIDAHNFLLVRNVKNLIRLDSKTANYFGILKYNNNLVLKNNYAKKLSPEQWFRIFHLFE